MKIREKSYWEKKARATSKAVTHVQDKMPAILRGALPLEQGTSYQHPIPVKIFFAPSGQMPELNDALDGMIGVVQVEVNRFACPVQKFHVCGGTWGGIEHGRILVRRDL